MARICRVIGVAVLLLAGCQGGGSQASTPQTRAIAGLDAMNWAGAPQGEDDPALSPGRALAYVGGAPVHWQDLQAGLIEANGGQVLAEVILERMLAQRLAKQGAVITPQQIEAEKTLLIETLGGEDPDQSHRLLQALRQQRGLGSARFAQLLVRNAGLRLLVQDDVEISNAAIDQAYQFEYGPRYEARLIVAESLQEAADMVHRARQGESFIDLAIAHSTDLSRAQGGLIGPISPVDSTYPQAVRTTLLSLEPGEVADPVALDAGFAVLRLERKIQGQDVVLDDVKDALAQRVRRRVERMLMQRLARTMLGEADVIVLDPRLHATWQRHHKALLEGTR